MKLSTDGQGWLGTFASTIEFAFNSMLSNGEPVPDVTVIRSLGIGTQTIRGSVAAVTGGHVRFVDGPSINTDEIVSVEVKED